MDIAILLSLQQFREITGGVFNSFFMFITEMGWSIFPILFMACMYWCIDKKNGLYIITNAYLAAWINGVIKLTACVYRPWIRSSEIKPVEAAAAISTGYSFPSGHSANAIAVWGGTAVAYRKQTWLRNILILFVVFICFSRNYLGVHTPQDVLVSSLIGISLLYVTYRIIPIIDEKPEYDKWVLIGCIVMSVFMILYASLKSYPMDYVNGELLVDPKKMALDSWAAGGEILGFGIAWYAERRWVKFTVDGSSAERLQRFIIGALVFSALFYLLSPVLALFLPKSAAYFIAKMTMSLFIVLLYPMWFTRMKKGNIKPQPGD